jgi:hypothetical protein
MSDYDYRVTQDHIDAQGDISDWAEKNAAGAKEEFLLALKQGNRNHELKTRYGKISLEDYVFEWVTENEIPGCEEMDAGHGDAIRFVLKELDPKIRAGVIKDMVSEFEELVYDSYIDDPDKFGYYD